MTATGRLNPSILVAYAAGARHKPACETAGIDLRTLQRWQAGDGLVGGDRRPQAVRPVPREGAQGGPAADHAHRHCRAPALVLEHDLPTCRRR